MQVPVQIEFDGMAPSDAIAARIMQRVEHLEKLFPRIISGRTVVELTNHRHRKGNLFRIHIELSVPRERLVVSRDPGANPAHTDVYVAIRDAFDAMERVLRDYASKMRYETKHHAAPLAEGRICRLFPYEGYGFITTPDEREVYFDANAVVGHPFDRLAVGRAVRFCEELGENGPQASTVHG